MKKQILWLAVLIAVSGLTGFAQDKSGTNMGEKPSGAKLSASEQSTERLQLAYDAAKYGRQTKSADALILAARIIKETPADKLSVVKTTEGGTTGAAKSNAGAMTAESLIADARRFAGKDKATISRIEVVEKMNPGRGALGGAKRTTENVNAGASDVFKIAFRGGESAVILVSGDGDTDLDLLVYDENGNLVASDTDGSDDCAVRFYPKWSGNFLVRVQNLGNISNTYVMATN